MAACFSFREFGQKGKAITEYRAMNSSAARDRYIYIVYIFLFLFFCVFLVSYITSNFSPVRRIINRFIYTIFEFIATFLRELSSLSATFPSKEVVKTDTWILLINESHSNILPVSKSVVSFRLKFGN